MKPLFSLLSKYGQSSNILEPLSKQSSFLSIHVSDSKLLKTDVESSKDLVYCSHQTPKWTRSMSITVPLYRHALERYKNSVAQARSMLKLLPCSTPKEVNVETTSFPRDASVFLDGMDEADFEGNIGAEWVVHKDSNNEKVVLFFHGGCHMMSSPQSHRSIAWRLSKYLTSPVLSVDYRLAPENPFPLPLHDAISSYLHLLKPEDPSKRAYQPKDIILAGDSSGGGLALSVALWIRDNMEEQPHRVILMSPWLDLTHSQPSFQLNNFDYLPTKSLDPRWIEEGRRSHYYTRNDSYNSHPLVSPLFAQEIPCRKLPPILIQTGQFERLRDESIVFCRSFGRSDITLQLYDEQVHVFHGFASYGEPSAIRAFEKMTTFLSQDPLKRPSFSRVDTTGKVIPLTCTQAFDIVHRGRESLLSRFQGE